MSEIKNCPFCGGEAVLLKFPESEDGIEWEEPYSVECQGCGTYKNDFATEKEAIEDWNRRTELKRWENIRIYESGENVRTIASNCEVLIKGADLLELISPDPRQLTPDELIQMDGQPVWVEDSRNCENSGWHLVNLRLGKLKDGFNDYFRICDIGERLSAYDRLPGGDGR